MTNTIALALTASVSALLAMLLLIMKSRTNTLKVEEASKQSRQTYLQDLKDIENQLREKKIDSSQADKKRLLLLETCSGLGRPEGQWLKLLLNGRQTPFIAALGALAVASIVGLFAVQTGVSKSAGKSTSNFDITQTATATPSKESLQALRNYLKGGLEQAAQAPLKTFPQSKPASLPDVDTMIARLVARLEKTPNDTAGWRTLGWSYFQTQKYAAAVKAYAHAVKLNPKSVPINIAFGEAMVMADGGEVKLRSIKHFKTVLELAPSNARALYFVGISKEQAGDHQGALKDWNTALKKAPSGESWVTDLKSRIQKAQGSGTTDVANSKLENDKTSAEDPGIERTAATTAPDAKTLRMAKARASSMSPEVRQAMIKGMVDRLDARLRSSPKNEDGWVRLMRSRMVLGQTSAARNALGRALAAFSDEKKVKARIAEKARSLGIEAN